LEFSRLYLDTNALLYALEGEDDRLRASFRNLFGILASSQIFTSELTLAELLVGAYKADDLARVERYKNLFALAGNGFVSVVPVSTAVLTHAAGFRGRQLRFLPQKPKLVDSIHAATAYLSGCSHFVTSDKPLKLWDQITKVPADVASIDEFARSLQ
jgi:predicted nucleic acid-binding protein